MIRTFTTKSLRIIAFTLFILFSGLTSMAQVIPNALPQDWDTLPFKSYADYKLQNLNKSYINTGVLYDRMLPIARLEDFIAGLSIPDTTSPVHFAQAYYEIYNSTYNTSAWKSPELLDSLITTQGNTHHPIGIFFYKYNVVDTNALADHLLDTLTNGQFTDKFPRPRSPYFTYSSFMASPLLADDQVMEEGEHTFYVDDRFFLHNEFLNITQIKIDFGDGQGDWVVNNPFATGNSRSMQPNGISGSIFKNISGSIVGRIIVIGVDILGQTVQYGSPFKVLVKKSKPYEPLTACKGLQKWVINADASRLAAINAQYPNTHIDYKGRKDTAYFYFAGNGSSCNTGVLRKPIVFIDGFDPTNDRGVQKIYEGYINLGVTRQNTSVKFGDYMLSEEYDFVILDFKHGNDLLERNAMTLVKLLQQLYATYGSTFEQEITLIGPSMGSLIAQYALAYMEHNGIPHHVKTYISFDGCHQGANVPIGLQNFVEYITKRGVLKKMDVIRDGLYNGLAARQMLAHHVSAGSQFPAPDAFRTKFLQNLAAVGEYPTQCRKVAVINGANNGTLNPAQIPGSDMLNISLKRKGWKSIWGLCDANVCKIFNWIARTAPNNGSIKVAEMWTASPLFNVLFWVPLGKTNYYGAAAWNNSALDNAPGGRFGPVFASSQDESDYAFLAKEALYLITGSKRFSFVNHIDNFTMMPSYSAADLRFSNKNLYMNWSNEDLCGKTPFDYVYAPAGNEQHVYVSQDNSEWFEAEIKCAKQDLPVFVSPIAGSPDLCSSEIYSISTCKPGNRTITWKVSNPNIAAISGAGEQITLTKKQSGVITLSATITYPCGVNGELIETVVSKQVTVGQRKPGEITWMWDTPPRRITLSVDPVPGATSYNWYLNGYFKATTTNTFYVMPMTGNVQCGQFYDFGVRAQGNCGLSEESHIGAWMPACNQGFRISPNPASDHIKIEAGNNSLQARSSEESTLQIRQVEIHDKTGMIIRKQSYTKGTSEVSISINNLASDVYSVRVFDGNRWHTYKIAVRH